MTWFKALRDFEQHLNQMDLDKLRKWETGYRTRNVLLQSLKSKP